RPRWPRPRRQNHRPRPARRRHGGHLHRPAPNPRDDRLRRRPGRCGRRRPLHPLRRPQHPLPPAHEAPPRKGHARCHGSRRRHHPRSRHPCPQTIRHRRRLPPRHLHPRHHRLHPLPPGPAQLAPHSLSHSRAPLHFVIPTGVPRFPRHAVEGSRHKPRPLLDFIIPTGAGRFHSFAPHYGASGRAARFVCPVRFAGVEVRFCIARLLCDESLCRFSPLCALCVLCVILRLSLSSFPLFSRLCLHRPVPTLRSLCGPSVTSVLSLSLFRPSSYMLSVSSVVKLFPYLLCFLCLIYFLYFFASLSNFTRVYKTRNPCRMIFLCDTLPGCARLTAIVHPASAALCSRAASSAVCTPRLRKSGSVLAPNSPATVPRRASVAPPATRPSTRAK